MPLIPALGRQRYVDLCKFQASLNIYREYIFRNIQRVPGQPGLNNKNLYKNKLIKKFFQKFKKKINGNSVRTVSQFAQSLCGYRGPWLRLQDCSYLEHFRKACNA